MVSLDQNGIALERFRRISHVVTDCDTRQIATVASSDQHLETFWFALFLVKVRKRIVIHAKLHDVLELSISDYNY